MIAKLARRANETYISPNMLAESIVFELCRSGGLDENLKVVNAALRERRDALVDALREHIPEAQFVVPEGGYFLWLEIDGGVKAENIAEIARVIWEECGKPPGAFALEAPCRLLA